MKRMYKSVIVLFLALTLSINSISAEAGDLDYIRPEAEFIEDSFYESNLGEVAYPNGPVDPGLGHNYSPKTVTTRGTCRKSGSQTTYCTYPNCNIHPPVNKNLGRDQNNHEAWTSVDTPSTCTRAGEYGWKCSACGAKDVSSKSLASHHYVTISKSYATCTSDGVTIKRCDTCGDTTESVERRKGHDIVYETEPATYYSDGYELEYCRRCSYREERKLARLGTSTGSGGDSGTAQTVNNTQTAEESKSYTTTNDQAGDPVEVFTGAHVIEFKVISAGNLSVGLSYKSNKTIKGAFGNGFYYNYESFVEEKEGNILLYHSPSKYVVYTKAESDDVYRTKTQGSELDELRKNPDGTVTLNVYGKIFDYDKEGRLCKVTEKTGEVVEVSYKEKEITIKDLVSGESVRLIKNDKGLVSKVTNEGTAEATFVYDEEDNLVKYTDVDGFETTYSYNADGRIEKSIDADGNTCFEDFYNEDGKVEKQKDALGVESFFSYKEDEDGSVETTYTDRAGNKEIYEFDKYGHLTKETDTEGNTETSKYDDRGNLIEKTDACGNTEKYEFDGKNNLIKETDALGNETKFEYDESRNVTKVIFPNGGKETFTYDDKNRLISSTDLRGLTTENEYDANGLLIKSKAGDVSTSYTYENGNIKSLTDSYGNVTEFSYDSNGHISETKTSDGAVTKTAVSAYGNVLSKEDALSNVTSATYNWVDKPLTKVDEDGNVVSYTYNELELLKESKDANGNKTEYFYDSEEHLVKTVFPDGTFTENEYDKTGKLLSTTDALGNKTSFSYDANGNVVKETDKEGNETTFTYNAKGQVLTKADSKGNVTSFSYDSMGRKVTETNALGGVTKYSYNTAGDLVSIEDALGNVTSFTYDEYGRKVSETDPNGNTTTFKYDLNGNLVETINALGESTFYKYDSLNRLIKTSVVDEAHSVEIDYDLNGRVVSETDPNGNTTRKVYDKRGNISKVIDPLGYETSYVYDKNGNLISSTNAKGQTISYEINSKNQITKETNALNLESTYFYDNNGRLKSVVNPMGGVSENIFDKKGNVLELIGPNGAKTDFTYDSNNNLTSRSTVNGNSVKYTYNALNLADSMTNGRGQNFTYEYDLLGRITKSTSPEGETTYSYDRNSNVLTVTDLNGTITRTYDSLNRVSSVTDTYGNTVSYVYDSYGNLARLIYPDNTAVSYRYDNCGNITYVTDWEGRTTFYFYDKLNRETSCYKGDDSRTLKRYDEVGNIISIGEARGSYPTANTLYEYDELNRLTKETDTFNYTAYEYSYDDLSRVLSRITRDTIDGKVINEEKFSYDPAGNIVSSTGREAKKALSYIAEDNRIDLADGVKFTFDNDGNLISGKLFDKDTTLTYDSRNRLTGFNDDSYVYDAEDYRIQSIENARVEGDNNNPDSQTGEKNNDENKENDTPEPQEEPEKLLQPINLLAECYENFTLGWGGTWSGNYRAKFITKNTSKVEALLQGLSDHDGDGYGTMNSGDIDISGHKYLDITTCNCAVYIDGALLYDYTGQKTNGLVISKRIDITGKSRLRITASSWYSWDYRAIVASVTELKLDDPVTDIDYSDLLALNYDRFTLGWGGTWSGNVKRKFRSQSEKKVEAELGGLEDHDGYGYATLSSGNIDIAGWDYLDVETMNCAVYIDGVLQYDYSRYNTNNQVVSKRIDIKGKSTLLITSNSGYSRSYRVITASVTKIQLGKEISQASFGANIQESDGIFTVSNISSIDVSGGDNNFETDETIASQENGSDDTIVEEENASDVTGNELSENPDTEGQVSSNELEITDISSNEIALLDVSSNDATEIDVSENEIEEIQAPDEEPRTETIRYCYDRINKDLLTAISDTGRIVKYVYGNGLISSYTEETDSEGSKTSSFESYSYDLRGSVTRVTDEAGNVKTEYAYSTYGKRTVIFGDQNHFAVLGYCARDGVLTEENGLLYMRARYYSTELMRFINQDIVVGDISNSSSLNRYTYVEGNPATLIDPFGLCSERINNIVIGALDIGRGASEVYMGANVLGAGIDGMIYGCSTGNVPVALLSLFAIIGGLGEIGIGTSDMIEGIQYLQYAISNQTGVATNYVRDILLDGDYRTYEEIEMLLPGFSWELAKIVSAFTPQMSPYEAPGNIQTSNSKIEKAGELADEIIENNGTPLEGYKGGRVYRNIPVADGDEILPDGIQYREYDVNPYVKGQNRGTERIVIGNDGSVYYTDDHYHSFKKIR